MRPQNAKSPKNNGSFSPYIAQFWLNLPRYRLGPLKKKRSIGGGGDGGGIEGDDDVGGEELCSCS